jgi:hypothetical protein
MQYNATLSVMVSGLTFCGSLIIISLAVELPRERSFGGNFKLNYVVLCYILCKIRIEA